MTNVFVSQSDLSSLHRGCKVYHVDNPEANEQSLIQHFNKAIYTCCPVIAINLTSMHYNYAVKVFEKLLDRFGNAFKAVEFYTYRHYFLYKLALEDVSRTAYEIPPYRFEIDWDNGNIITYKGIHFVTKTFMGRRLMGDLNEEDCKAANMVFKLHRKEILSASR